MSDFCPDCQHEKAVHPGWGQPCEECPDWLDRCVNDFRKPPIDAPMTEPVQPEAREWHRIYDGFCQCSSGRHGPKDRLMLADLNALESALETANAKLRTLREALGIVKEGLYVEGLLDAHSDEWNGPEHWEILNTWHQRFWDALSPSTPIEHQAPKGEQ